MAKAKDIIPFSLKDASSVIEQVLPVQRLSIDVYKERMAGSGQMITALGAYWKGRKPLVLNRACVLGAILPATGDSKKDLEIFELLMGMDTESIRKRLQLSREEAVPALPYKVLSSKAKRVEEIWESVHTHIWPDVNEHFGTSASNHRQLVEQLGVMRFGHRPQVSDTFSGSGQIPFEAARLGCDVYASDLNPVACMLTWGAFNIVGASDVARKHIEAAQLALIKEVREEINELGFESDGQGWRGKVYLYCLEVRCPTSGWLVPVLPSLVVSVGKSVVATLVPDDRNKRYDIILKSNASSQEMKAAETGTYQREYVVHNVRGVEHRNKLSAIRGDYFERVGDDKVSRNKLRQWEINDIDFRVEDIFHERLYAIQWMKDDGSARPLSEFRTISKDDLTRELKVKDFVQSRLSEWQLKGWLPDMKIEPGFNTKQPIWERGWTYWHHLFNPRQLLLSGLLLKHSKGSPFSAVLAMRALNINARLSVWHKSDGGGGSVQQVFSNQALNTLNNYGSRGFDYLSPALTIEVGHQPINSKAVVVNAAAADFSDKTDIFITDPPYGDAVKYEEILEFFIAWLKKNPPAAFSEWIWDSRRALAIKGEDHDFKLGMVSAYKQMTKCMPDNGLQIIMFTHNSGSIWADMANIVWACGLRVTAAWYVVTETDSALREGQYIKGTILLVLRKRLKEMDTARDELAYELAEEVKTQVDLLTGLNKGVKDLYWDENLFEDADLQMAGYAAALRVLTRYSTIDGVSMPQEAMRPRVKGQTTMVDELIAFAVNIANEYLVPDGVDRSVWEKSVGIERFYLKMMDMESKGIHVLSNYQNFAKAFKVHDYGAVMDEVKANHANLKTAAQLGKRGMTAGEEFGSTVLRSVLYAVHLLLENKVKPEDVLHQLRDLVPDYFRERERITALADYVSKKTAKARPDESSNAMVLRDLVRRERV
jgi:putative DNA methylase